MAELGPEGQPGGPPSPTERARFESQLRWMRIFGVAFGAFLLLAVGLSLFHIFIGPNSDVEFTVAEGGQKQLETVNQFGVTSEGATVDTVISTEGEHFDVSDKDADLGDGGVYRCTAQGFTWLPWLDRSLEDCTEIEAPPPPPGSEPVKPGAFIACAETAAFPEPKDGDALVDAVDGCFPGGLTGSPGLYNCLLTGPAGKRTSETIHRCAKGYLSGPAALNIPPPTPIGPPTTPGVPGIPGAPGSQTPTIP